MHAAYCPESNRLRIYPSGTRVDSILDETEYSAFKSCGYKWAGAQECFVAPWSPAAEDWALELCGEIEDEDYSPEERAADRAERFSGYRDKRRSEANSTADTFDAGPSAFGHANRNRAERQANRHDRYRTRAVSQWSKAEYWQTRTAGVIRNALHKSTAAVRRDRILRLEAEQRKHEKSREEYKSRFEAWHKVYTLEGLDWLPAFQEPQSAAWNLAYMLAASGNCWGNYKHPRQEKTASIYSLMTDPADPITAREAAELWLANAQDPDDPDTRAARWSAHYALRLAYENQMLENEGGKASEVEMEVGGWIGRHQIHGINRSPVTKRVVSVKLMCAEDHFRKAGLRSINIERLGADVYRAPTDEERAQFAKSTTERKAKAKAEKPASGSLINPTDADAEKLQAIWNQHAETTHIKRGRHGDYQPVAVRRMTQAEYSARSKGDSPYTTVEVSEQLRERYRNAMGSEVCGRVTVFKVRKAPGGGGFNYRADSVVILTDKPQKPIDWEAIDTIRAEQPSEETLDVQELAKVCGEAWLPNEGTPERQLIEDGVYLGWAYISSVSQFGLTPAGNERLKSLQLV